MKELLTLTRLNELFELAKLNNSKYFAVQVKISNIETSETETIINPRDNFEGKQLYYNNSYDEQLKHKYANIDIRIVGFTCGNSFAEIEESLKFYEVTGSQLDLI